MSLEDHVLFCVIQDNAVFKIAPHSVVAGQERERRETAKVGDNSIRQQTRCALGAFCRREASEQREAVKCRAV